VTSDCHRDVIAAFLCVSLALMRLPAPRLIRVISDTTVLFQLFPLTSSSHGHVTDYYVTVVPANHRVASNDVKLDKVCMTPWQLAR